MTSIVSHVLHFHGPWAYTLVGGLCFSESAFIVAFFIPGETALVFGGVLSSEHHVSLGLMIATAVVSTSLGYFVGFWLGAIFGPARARVAAAPRPRGSTARVRRSSERGGVAVVVARFIPVVRAFMPGGGGRLRASSSRCSRGRTSPAR